MNDQMHQNDREIEAIGRELDKLGAFERASAPHGLAGRIAERTAPLIAGRVGLVGTSWIRTRLLAPGLAAAAGIAVVLGVGAVIVATRTAPEVEGERLLLAAEATLDDLDRFLAYGDMENEVESLFAETELLSATLGIEGSPWVDQALEESL